MDVAVILTYRCNSRCATCHVWQHPTLPAEEITPAVLAKLPGGFGQIVLTGGEPTLRADLEEIVDLLRPKARRLEIATNGLQAEDPTIAELLKPLGYATGQFGKNHFGDRDEHLPTVHGFDEFFGNLYHLNAEEEPEYENYPKAYW